MGLFNRKLEQKHVLDYPKNILKTSFIIILFNLFFSLGLYCCSSDEGNNRNLNSAQRYNNNNSTNNNFLPDYSQNSSSNNQQINNQSNNLTNSSNSTDISNSNDNEQPDSSNNSSPGYDCFEITSEAQSVKLPVDIVWMIDTSGSMGDEVDLINQRMNDFAAFIGASGIDYHVIVIADKETLGRHTFDICIGPPLSSSDECPDTDGEFYRHVRQHVGSHDGLEVILNTYPDYRDFIRDDSMVHFIAVSDDESSLSSNQFKQRITQLDNPRLSFRWIFHSIVSDYYENFWGMEKGCSGPYGDAVSHGEQYIKLSEHTDGIFSEICTADWDSIFQTIAENVLTSNSMPCAYSIPETPDGLVVDFSQIDVDMTITENGQETEVHLQRVNSEQECNGDSTWYFDDNNSPTIIFLCPTACGNEITGEIHINFKCVKG